MSIFYDETVYIECGPIICEEHFSGIPNVNMHLIRNTIQEMGEDKVHFFHGPDLINKKVIEEVVGARSNSPVHTYRESGELFIGDLREHVNNSIFSIGIFTNSRHNLGRIFDYECQIFHDLTPMITPEFHHEDTIEFHALEYERDVEFLDCAICVSNSTRIDVETYLKVPSEKTMVSHLGFENENSVLRVLQDTSQVKVEPYIVIVGTIEPRKNHRILFEFLANNPDILDKYKVLIIGRSGWNINFEELMSILDGVSVERKERVIQLGFVSEELKAALIANAKFSVYPSYYEGFGLPVLESLALGCPVLASASSSIPEAGGDVCEYFDPDSIESFTQSFHILENKIKNNNQLLVDSSLEWSKKFTWDRFSKRIYRHIAKNIKNKVGLK